MKRIVTSLVLFAALLLPSLAAAQTHGGIIGGPGLSRVVAEDDDFQEASEVSAAYSIGVQGSVAFRNFIGLNPQLLFSRRGWNTDGPAYGQDFATDFRLSYLELPILLRIAVPIGDFIAPKLIVGPHAALFLDGKAEGDTSGPFLEASTATDIDSEDVNDVQFGITAGLGLDINFDLFILTTDVRYVRNFTKIFETDLNDEKLYHESYMLMVGLMF